MMIKITCANHVCMDLTALDPTFMAVPPVRRVLSESDYRKLSETSNMYALCIHVKPMTFFMF